MDIFKDQDRKLLQTHCRFRALAILNNKQEDADIKEAIAYLSFAIIASGRVTKVQKGSLASCTHLFPASDLKSLI